jgi:hypothetical protein
MSTKKLAARKPQPPLVESTASGALNTGSPGKIQAVKFSRSRPPHPWRQIGDLVGEVIARIGRAQS